MRPYFLKINMSEAKKILLMEPGGTPREVISRDLKKKGHEVESTDGTVEVETGRFDLLIAEILKCNGDPSEQIIAAVCSAVSTGVPVIVSTTLSERDAEVMIDASTEGGIHFLKKPHGLREIRAAVRGALTE
jgi:DNA-binding response OmpR family regulator